MARETILVNTQRCTGCWSCSIGCKMANGLDDDTFRIYVRTLGNGTGTDHPAGTWPDLHMSWEPVWTRACTDCTEKATEHDRFCVYTCPSGALSCGEAAERERERLESEGFEVASLDEEGLRPNVLYARKAGPGDPARWEMFPIVEKEPAPDGPFVPTLDGTTIGELAENPETATILAEHLPWLDLSAPESAQAKGMTLAGLAPYTQGLLDDDALAAIQDDFDAVEARTFTLEGTTIGEMAGNPIGARVLAEHLPWLDLESEQGAQVKGMTLTALAPLTQGLLGDGELQAISDELAGAEQVPA